MDEGKSIKKNMIMNIILTASNFIFPLITYSYVARVLGTEGTGKVAFANSVLQYFSYAAILGIPTYGLRECAQVRDNRELLSHTVQELFAINLISTGIAYILMIMCMCSISKLFDYRSLLTIMSISILLNTIGMEWVYKALEEYTYITTRSIIFKLIAVILTFILIKSSDDFLWYGFLSIFTLSASNICNFINIRKYVSFKKTHRYNFKRHIRPIFTLFVATAVLSVYANFDISMIGFISSDNEVGLYNSALKIKSILLSISTAITSVLIPRMAYNIKQKNDSAVDRLVLNSFRISLILALPLAIYVFVFSKNVILFVCGKGFIDAVNTLRILILCIIPLILTNLFGNQLLIPLGDEKRYSQSVFIGMIINIILNLYMIPAHGAGGAAFATLITELWNVFWMGLGVKKFLALLIRKTNYLKYLISMFICSCFSWTLNKFIIQFNIFFQLLATSSVFFIVYYGMLVLFKEPLIYEQLSILITHIKRTE